MKIAAIYARVSSEQQKDSNTISSQTQALVAHAKHHGFRVAPGMIFEDEGCSGAVLERPGLEQIRDLAAEGRIEAVLALSPDRLSRRYAHQVLIVEELARQGVETVFANAPSMETPEEMLLVQFQGMIAEYESAQILERSRRGKRHRARQGEVSVLSGAPYGYLYHKKTQDSDAYYEINEPQAAVVKDVYRYYICEHMSLGAIACKLNECSVPTATGRSRWERSTVSAILRNPAYMGRACYGKTRQMPRQSVPRPLRQRGGAVSSTTDGHQRPRQDWIEIPVPAIVSEETFELAAERLEKNKALSPRSTKIPSVVQGLVSCGKCGYALSRTSARTSARRISYYRCLGSDAWRRLNGRHCDNRPVRQDLLDDMVWSEVVRLLEEPELVGAEIDRRLESTLKTDPDSRREAELHSRLARVGKGIDRLVTAFQEELITIDELRARTTDLRRQQQALQRELQSTVDRTRERETWLRLAETANRFLARLRSSADNLEVIDKQRIVRMLVKEVLVSEEKIVIRHSIPLPDSPGGEPKPSNGDKNGEKSQSCLLRKWGHHSALRCARLGASEDALVEHAGSQPLVDHAPDRAVLDRQVERRPQVPAVDAVDILRDVGIDHPVQTLQRQAVPQGAERHVRGPLRPEAVRAGKENSLSQIGSRSISTARCATLSSSVGMPSGLCAPSAFGIQARRTGGA